MQKKKGISLIVLVITIIVMIVLAGAIILSLNNNGIIGKANVAVKDTDLATVKELAQMAWAEAYASGERKVEGDNGLRAKVEDALRTNGINKEGDIDYYLNVTTKGVTVKPIEEAWILDGEELKVKRAEEELTIGQVINYDETAGKSKTGLIETEWKVLGADEDGNLLIMSTSDVKTNFPLYTTTDTLTVVQKTWLGEGINKLNAECAIYGKGTGAINARCITVEDIDKITGYDKTTYASTSIYKYGNEVTYTFNGTTKPTYTGANGITGELTDHPNGFCWYDEGGFHKITELTNEENKGKEITKVTSTYHGYKGANKISADSEAHKMLFGTEGSYNEYWLASPFVYPDMEYIYFGFRVVREGYVNGTNLWFSTGKISNPTRGVRAVVTISSEVETASLTQ